MARERERERKIERERERECEPPALTKEYGGGLSHRETYENVAKPKKN